MVTAAAAPARTDQADLDRIAERLREAAPGFAALPLDARLRLLIGMMAGYRRVAAASVAAACDAKRIPRGSSLAGEEWVLGPVITLHHLRLLRLSLQSLNRSGTTRVGRIDRTVDGRVRVNVFPPTRLDGIVFRGINAAVHLQPGAAAEDRACFYRQPAHAGRVVLVLGAGNVNAITPLDVITKMFNEGKVCLVKMNPVNEYLGPFLEEAFAEPIAAGYLAITYGGAEEGQYLADHAAVDEVHLTGSNATHDALVWGPPGMDRDTRKAQGRPRLSKPVTSELGNISPVIVVPGPYTPRQIAWQAENIAGGMTNNASFNCNAHKMLITGGTRAGGTDLVDAIERMLSSTPARYAYYPGADGRYRSLTAGRTRVDTFGDPRAGELPWTVLRDLDATAGTDPAFSIEPFCAILSETRLETEDPVEFLDRAVRFANTRLWGTLVASLVIHPSLRKDPAILAAIDRAVVALRYGTVGINVWGAYGFALGSPWGGHPSSGLADIQSGVGFVHNTAMVDAVEKTVLEQPIVSAVKPIHFPSHRTAGALGPRLATLEGTGSWTRLPSVLSAALRG